MLINILKKGSAIIPLQIISALFSMVASFLIIDFYGLDSYGLVNFWFSIFALSAIFCSCGLPEEAQYYFSDNRITKLVDKFSLLLQFSFKALLFILVINYAVADLIGLKFLDVLAVYVYAIIYIVLDIISRYFFQRGEVFKGQVLLTALPVFFWVFATVFYSFWSMSAIILTSALFPLGFAVYFLGAEKLKRSIAMVIKIMGKHAFSVNPFPSSGAVANYVSRVNALCLDFAPTILLSLSGHLVEAGLYSLFARLLMPFALIANAVSNVLTRLSFLGDVKLNNVLKISLLYVSCLAMFLSAFFAVLHWQPAIMDYIQPEGTTFSFSFLLLAGCYRLFYQYYAFVATVLIVWFRRSSFQVALCYGLLLCAGYLIVYLYYAITPMSILISVSFILAFSLVFLVSCSSIYKVES